MMGELAGRGPVKRLREEFEFEKTKKGVAHTCRVRVDDAEYNVSHGDTMVETYIICVLAY